MYFDVVGWTVPSSVRRRTRSGNNMSPAAGQWRWP